MSSCIGEGAAYGPGVERALVLYCVQTSQQCLCSVTLHRFFCGELSRLLTCEAFPLLCLMPYQLCCTILDDVVNTNEIVDQIESLGMTPEQLEKLHKRQEEGEEDDEDEETYGLVQSAEIVSFNKL